MNSIDIKNAFTGSTADNFTVLLLRLIAKADPDNRRKLHREFRCEVNAVNIFKNACPYTTTEKADVDWDMIDLMAKTLSERT